MAFAIASKNDGTVDGSSLDSSFKLRVYRHFTADNLELSLQGMHEWAAHKESYI